MEMPPKRLLAALLRWTVGAAMLIATTSGTTTCDEQLGAPLATRVVQRPGDTFRVTTAGTSSTNRAEVQRVEMFGNQVLDVLVRGTVVTGGTFALEFCDFTVSVPGTILFAPIPGDSTDQRLILVSTDNDNVTRTWKEFGVYDGFPLKISTSRRQEDVDAEVYQIFFEKCVSCKNPGFTMQLDRPYSGPTIGGGSGSAWGCSWSAPSLRLAYDAGAAQLKAAFEAALGAGSVDRVERTTIDNQGGFRFRVTMAKGYDGVFARVDGSQLRGQDLDPVVRQVTRGVVPGTPFSAVASQWSGGFTLSHRGVATKPIPPSATALEVQTALRELSTLGSRLVVSKAADGWSWVITFIGEVGDQPTLGVDASGVEPTGASLAVLTAEDGEARLEGEFELVNQNNGRSVRVPVAATEFLMETLLREDLGLGDVVVHREGPSESNGFQWTVLLSGDCPDTFDLAIVSETQVREPCDVALVGGPATAETLLGNGASLSVTRHVVLDFANLQGSGSTSWALQSRAPPSLPAPQLGPDLGGGLTSYEFPLGENERGRYVFHALREGSSEPVLVQAVYVDAGPPVAQFDPGAAVPIFGWVDLDGSQAYATFGSQITSYRWRVTEVPRDAPPGTGGIIRADAVQTVAVNITVPGFYTYKLEVRDSLGFVACASRRVEVLAAPEILGTFPDLQIVPGEDLELTCNATGSLPLMYTWRIGTVALDADGATLRLVNVRETDQGNYTCSVSNEVGSVTSNAFKLDVLDAVEIQGQPESTTVAPGAKATFSCVVGGSAPLRASWQRRDATTLSWEALKNQTAPAGAERATFAFELPSVTEALEGEFRCVVSNPIGQVASRPALLQVLDKPTNVTAWVEPKAILIEGADEGPAGAFRLRCSAFGMELSYAWERRGNAFAATQDIQVDDVAYDQHAGPYVCIVSNGAGAVASAPLEFVINTPPIIVRQPVALTVDPGESAVFTVFAEGARPLQYLWKKDGQFLNEQYATNSTLELPGAQEGDSGSYAVVVFNHLGFKESVNVRLTVRDPPYIVEPLSAVEKTVDPGGSTMLRCAANGTGALSFHWELREEVGGNFSQSVAWPERSGPNFSELRLSNLENDDEGDFVCVVSSRLGVARSEPIRLSVADPPFIIEDPETAFAEPGEDVVLQVVAGGVTPLSYQWRKDGIPVSRSNAQAFGDRLVLTGVSEADEGVYDVRVTNRLSPISGTVSRAARVQLARAPAVVTQPVAHTVVDPGEEVLLRAEVGGAPPMSYFWTRRRVVGGKLVLEALESNLTQSAHFQAQLYVPAAAESDEAGYFLTAWNRLGNASSELASVHVNNPPEIISERITYAVDPGQWAEFECEVRADPPVRQVIWSFLPASGLGGPVVLDEETGMRLRLNNVTQSHEGEYSCAASNSAGFTSKTVGKLDVRDPPTIVSLHPVPANSVLTLDPGQPVTLTAIVTGLRPLDFEWFVHGELAQSGPSEEFRLNTTMAGYVRVRVRNVLGQDSAALQVLLNEPAQVYSLTALPTSGRVLPGSSASLTCEVAGTAPLTIIWLRNGEALEIGPDGSENYALRMSRTQHNVSTLEIPRAAHPEHTAAYSCLAANSANPQGNTSEAVSLTVVRAPVLEASRPADATHLPGTNTTFDCRLKDGAGPFRVRWFYTEALDDLAVPLWNMTKVEAGKYFGAERLAASGPRMELVIASTAEADQGLYRCEACNEAGCATSRWASLGVHDSPRIAEQIPAAEANNLTANPGEEVVFSVTATGLEPLEFTWVRMDGTLALFEPGRVLLRPENCSRANVPCELVFDHVLPKDEGEYMCVVSNFLGMTASVPAALHVTRPPALQSGGWPSNLVTACPGSPFVHELPLLGTLPISIEWFFAPTFEQSGDIFQSEPRWSSDAGAHPMFRIDSPRYSDEGYYAFRATNAAGDLRSTVARLEVTEGPSAAADALGVSPHHAVTLPQTFTRLFGTASANAVAFHWALVSSPSASPPIQILHPELASTDVIGLEGPGVYVFALTVTGPNGCVDEDTVTVTVNRPPVPVSGDQLVTLPLEDGLELDASASYDPDVGGSIVAFAWELHSFEEMELDAAAHNLGEIDGDATSATVRLAGLHVGQYEVRLTVTDNNGASTSRMVRVTVINVSILAPAFPLSAPFIIGSCYEHDIGVMVEGRLPLGANTEVRIELAQSQGVTPITSARVVDLLQGASAGFAALWDHQSRARFLRTQWKVGQGSDPGPARVQVVLDGKLSARAQSPPFEVMLPHRFVVGEWGPCDCEAGIRERPVHCVGFDVDLASSASCEWRQVAYDVKRCAALGSPPLTIERCEPSSTCTAVTRPREADYWRAGPWSQDPESPLLEAFCSRRGCGAARSRVVDCVDGSGHPVALDRCQAADRPAASQQCAWTTACTGLEWQQLDEFAQEPGSTESCVAITRATPQPSGAVERFCVHRASGFLLWPSEDLTCAGEEASALAGAGAPELCEHVWRVSEWQCNKTEGLAMRDVACVEGSTGSAVSADLCMARTAKRPIAERPCSPITGSETPHASWRVGAWSSCPDVDCRSGAVERAQALVRSRAVRCVDQHGDDVDDSFCAGVAPRPQVLQACEDPCAAPCGSCGAHGICNLTTATCTCLRGWEGARCDSQLTETAACSVHALVDASGACCPANALVGSDGRCCRSASSRLDAKGECCDDRLDACGVCGGSARFVDIAGACCAGVLDAGGSCCASGVLDRCGVCDGTGLTCDVELRLEGTVTLNETVPLDRESDRDQARRLLEDELRRTLGAALGGDPTVYKLELPGPWTGSSRRVLADEGLASEFRLRVGAAPGSGRTAAELSDEGLWRGRAGISLSSFGALSRGVCGNGVCEVQEQCLVTDGVDGCCPFDCAEADPRRLCPDDCSGNGKCLPADGRCDCFAGYSGDSCSACAVGAVQVGTRCLPKAWVPLAEARAPASDTERPTLAPTVLSTVIVDRQVNVWWPTAVVSVLLILLWLALWYYCMVVRAAGLPQANKYEVHATMGGPQCESLDAAFGRIPVDAKPRGWIWKRSRTGLKGAKVWQQWYAVQSGPFLYYFSSDAAMGGLHALEDDPSIERGCVDLREVDRVAIKAQTSSERLGGWRFDLVLREPTAPGRDETVDVLDAPVVKRRNSVTDRGSGCVEFMCDSRSERERWSAAMAGPSCRGVVDVAGPSRGDGESATAAGAGEHSVVIEFSSSSSPGSVSAAEGEWGEAHSSSSSVTADVSNLVVGSFSGAVGFRVSYEGWIRDVQQNRNVYGVLLGDLDEFAVFETMSPARDGAHHYIGRVQSVPLARVTSVVAPHTGSSAIELHYSQGLAPRMYAFVASSRSRRDWERALQQHMHYRHGVDVTATPAEPVALPPLAEGLGSPVSPVAAANEPLASLKLRRVSSGASLALGDEDGTSRPGRGRRRSSASRSSAKPLAPTDAGNKARRGRASSQSKAAAGDDKENPLSGPVLPRKSSLASLLDPAPPGARRPSAWSTRTDGSEEFAVV